MVQITLKGYPNDKQKEFFLSTSRHIAYGGARGGGKSWAMRRKFVLLALKYPGLKLLLLRRTLPELRENHIMPLLSELYGHATYKETDKSFTFPNGSRLKLGYCDHEKDVFQYQGQEYDVIGFEEATHFSESMKDFIITSNRSTRTDFTPRVYYTSNPGNVGHHWFKRLFIDRDYRAKEKAENYSFIPAKVYDNTVLMQNNPEYIETLENLPENQRRAMLDGDWDAFDGQYFSEFNRDIHTMDPFVIPSHWRRYVAIDYGLDMLAAYWIAVDTQGFAYVYKELYQSNLIISEAAERMKEVNASDSIYRWYAPPDLWNRRQETGKSAVDLFRENGILFRKSNNDRVQGWYNVKEWIKPYDTRDEQTGKMIKVSKLRIFKNCLNLIRTIPQLQFDDKDPNDVANDPHEITHAPDAIRYFCSARPMNTVIDKDYDPDNLTPTEKHQKAINAMTGGKPKTSAFTKGW
jgi:phage terminase large subunit